MKNREKRYERFMKDPIPVRLGGLAANLARISSSARRESGSDIVSLMLEESQWQIEWVAPETEPEIAVELVDIQRNIALWRAAWAESQKVQIQRTILSVQAKSWSDKVLDYSGLLDE